MGLPRADRAPLGDVRAHGVEMGEDPSWLLPGPLPHRPFLPALPASPAWPRAAASFPNSAARAKVSLPPPATTAGQVVPHEPRDVPPPLYPHSTPRVLPRLRDICTQVS